MVQAGRAATPGSVVELHRGPYVIVARVMWQDGVRAGLQVDGPLPVDEMMTLSQAPGLQLAAESPQFVERRKKPRTHEMSRLQSRAIEFAALAFVAGALSVAAFGMLQQAVARPMHSVAAALP